MEAAKKNTQLIDTRTEVSLQEKTFLVHGTQKVPIRAQVASKYSLFFHYLENHPLLDPNEPINLLIRNNGQSVELGPCRILPGPDLNGYHGRLVFIQAVYDFECLLGSDKINELQAPFSDLPLVLRRKDTIRPSFKEYTANLTYDLNVYKKLFDSLDSQYCEEPDDVRESIQNAIFNTEGQKFMRFLDEKLDELKNTISDFSKEEHQRHGFYFRKQLWNFLLSYPFAAQCNLKPRGYPGDSEIMRMIYYDDYQGDSTFAKLMHKHGAEQSGSQSVRNRIELIANLLNNVCDNNGFSPQQKMEVLSVGCGPAFEIKDIVRSPQDCENFHFIFMDQDPQALSEAGDLIHGIEKKFARKIEVDYIHSSVRTTLFSRTFMAKFNQFHFIYSMGLFDYLTAPVAKAVIARLYQKLKPNGEMVIGNFHVSNPSRYYMEYWGDWVIIHRTEDEFKNLLQNDLSAHGKVLFENTGNQMFLHLKKPPN